MIDLKRLRLFPFATSHVAFTQTEDNKHYNVIFFPENSTFSQAYPKMGIKKRFVRFGTVPAATVPRLVLNAKTLIVSNGLQHYSCEMNHEKKSYSFLKEIPRFSEKSSS